MTEPGAAPEATPGARARGRAMRGSSLGLVCGKVTQLGGGFVFWLVAARMTTPHQLGLATALVSGVMLCTQLALLGVGAAVIRTFPVHSRDPAPLLDAAGTLVAVAAVAAATVFLLLSGTLTRELAAVAGRPGLAVLVLAAVVLGTLGVLLDQVSMALRRGGQVLVRAAAGVILPIGSVAVWGTTASRLTATQLFGCWVAGCCSPFAVGGAQLWRTLRYRYRPRFGRELAVTLLRQGAPNHGLTLSERVPGLLLPLLVTELLSPSTAAYWYPVWMMAWAVYVAPVSVGIATFAEAAREPAAVVDIVHHSLRWSLALGCSGGLLLAVAAGPALGFMGPAYAAAGAWPLRILLLGLVPITVVQTFFSVARALDRLPEALALGAGSAVVAVAATVAGGMARGLTGMAVGWLASQCVAATVAGLRLRAALRWVPTADPTTPPAVVATGQVP